VSAVLTARGASLQLGAFSLGPVDLDIREGEYLVLVGPSGAGKTVLLETLIGWFQPGSGTVRLGDLPVTAIHPRDRRIAYVPQDLGLLPHLNIRSNLTWGLDCRGERPDPELFATLTRVLALEPILHRRRPETLSRGEQQRVALARALLTRPRILALDEPCAALDPHLRRELQLLLRHLHRERRTTVVHITHDREEAFLLGERIGVLLEGHLHQLASPRELYDRPADIAVARFLASENLWRGRVVEAGEDGVTVRLEESGLSFRSGDGTGSPGDAVLAGIRPEEVMLLHPGRPLRPQVAANIVEGAIADILLLDGRVQAALEADEGLKVVVRLPICAADDLGLQPGSRVRASLKPRSLYLLPVRE